MIILHAIPPNEKVELIRKFVDSRVKKGVLSRRLLDASGLNTVQLMETPEATIVTIAESYFIMQSFGVPDTDIFEEIEAYRSKVVPGWKKSRPSTLVAYAHYRTNIEHGAKRHLGATEVQMITTVLGDFMRRFYATEEATTESTDADQDAGF